MNIRNLSVCSYNNGFTLWHYRIGDGEGKSVRTNELYFSDAAAQMKAGDIIMASNEFCAYSLHVRKPTPNSAITTLMTATQ